MNRITGMPIGGVGRWESGGPGGTALPNLRESQRTVIVPKHFGGGSLEPLI
jgi:hypothetical protein